MIKLLRLRLQTNLDISEALSVCQLRKAHTEKLFPAVEFFHSTVAIVPIDALIESIAGNIG